MQKITRPVLLRARSTMSEDVTQWLNCISGLHLPDSVYFYKRFVDVDDTHMHDATGEGLKPDIFQGGAFGISAYTTHITTNPTKMRVKNSRLHSALESDLKAINNIQICKGFSYMDEDPGVFERGFVVAPVLPTTSLDEQSIVELMKKFKQTGYFKYSARGDTIVQQLIRTTDQLVISEDIIHQVQPPVCYPAFLHETNNSLFRKCDNALKVLKESNSEAAKEVIQIYNSLKIHDSPHTHGVAKPFIVVEGLDATGKSTLVQKLAENLGATQVRSPPDNLRSVRSFFDAQPELIRRAYYAVGNYVAAQEIIELIKSKPVIMDRFWHSTAAYTIATECISGDESVLPCSGHSAYQWPDDLAKPHLVVFLTIPENVRDKRLTGRATEVTREETALKQDLFFRKRVIEAYRRMDNPTVVEIDATASANEVAATVMDTLMSRLDI